MNQEEDIPARVTRGALRRRSVDQEATPQKPSATAVSGTPKKTGSTTKKVNPLNSIQESEGRPATPTVGRTGRRRMSETVDTPTSLPNKMVQNLKETSSQSGKRSRKTSLTEENLNELNVAYEGSSAMLSTRSRTPARVRASHETLVTSGSPLTVTPAVRRSTRRNSVTSDDGNISVQSLPIITPKISSGLRALKDDTIIEEDAGDDRAESVSSETSTRHMRSQSLISASASPRGTTASPVFAIKDESTPPRGSTTSRVALTPLSLSKMSPRSKNVSFSDDSKRDDTPSSFPKTPTCMSKEVFIIVEDLRNAELKGVSPKVDAEVDLSPKKVETEKQDHAEEQESSSKSENVESDNQAIRNEIVQGTIEDKTNASSSIVAVHNDEKTVGKASDNDVSGIDVLESSVKEVTDTEAEVNVTINDSIPTADRSPSERNKFSQSWSQSVRRSATKAIDEYSIPKEEEQERFEEAKESLPIAQEDSSFKANLAAAKQQPAEKNEDDEEAEEELQQRNEFVDDEALEVEDYESCESMDEDLKREIQENEIPDQGEDLGSEDTEENDDQEDDEDDNDSFVVSDGCEMDEEQLLRSSDEDLANIDSITSAKQPKTTHRRRIIDIPDDSEEEDVKEISIDFEKTSSPSKSPKSTASIRRSATPVSALQTSDIQTIEKTARNCSATPPKKIGFEFNSPVKMSSNKKQPVESFETASEKEDEIIECSAVMFEEANEVIEKGQQTVKENGTSLSTSPTKSGTSRKSLPATATNPTVPHVVADVRKSLPAKTKIYEKTDVHEEEKKSLIDNDENKEEVIDLEQHADVETSFEENIALHASSSQVTLEQPVNEVSKPDRKSMPPVSLISAQFYIGGTKKRNTVGGVDGNMLTSTPKPNEPSPVKNKKNKPVEEKMNSSGSNSVVRNPFALANNAKLKSRVSLDSSGTAVKQNAKKMRLSLPTNFVEEDLPSETGTGVNGLQQPEPMEVDEVIEDDVVNEKATKLNGDGETDDDDDVSVQEVAVDDKQRTKMVKPKPKALEDYDITNILVRCNEVMREDKERKKQLASVLRKKREEKKRQRELEKQEELEAAKNAANALADNDADPNNVNTSTGNDSAVQGEEPTKKKKKRKPKVKNYLLEELAETKKERLEQALRHKLEVFERRKQRKKDRQLEKKKQLDKENGNSVSVTGGIGAKLEKMKKRQKSKTSDEAKAAKENESNNAPAREALSAFAVFNQLQDNQIPLSPSTAAVDGKQIESSENVQLVKSAVEKKQLLKTSKAANENHTEKLLASSAVNKTSSPDNIALCEKKQNLTVKPEVPQTTSDGLKEDAGKMSKKQKKKQAMSPASGGSSENVQLNVLPGALKTSVDCVVKTVEQPEVPQATSDGLKEDAGKMSKKQKKKQATSPASSGSSENVQQNVLPGALKKSVDCVDKPVDSKVTAENKPYSKDEKSKDKKGKQEPVAGQENEKESKKTLNEADSDIPKQKKNKKIKMNGATEDHSKQLSTAIGEIQMKKHKKKLTSQTENDASKDGTMIEQSRKKPVSVVMEPTIPIPSIVPAKKRKREQQGDGSVASTPRPAKHTKLRVLQRIESGGFFVENVTPDKVRLQRNFGFQERQATPAKQLGFKVSSLLPTGQEELRGMATSSKKYSKEGRKQSKFGDVAATGQNSSLPLPVWTSSGVFFESAADGNGGESEKKKTQTEKTGYIQLKSQGKGEFNIKSLRPGLNAEKPHRVDPTTTDQSVLNFKRQQLLEKTAHLREKKKSQRV